MKQKVSMPRTYQRTARLLLVAVFALAAGLLAAGSEARAAPATAPQEFDAKLLRHAFRLTWGSPTSQADTVTHYRIEYREASSSDWTLIERVTKRNRYFHRGNQSQGPEHGVRYQYRVGALRNNGSTVQPNDWSDVATKKYKKEYSHAPWAHLYYDDGIYFRIRGPSVLTGVIDSYELQWRQRGAGDPTRWANLTDLPDPDSNWIWYDLLERDLLRECYDVQFCVRANYTDGYDSLWVKTSVHWDWHSGCDDLFAPQGSQSTVSEGGGEDLPSLVTTDGHLQIDGTPALGNIQPGIDEEEDWFRMELTAGQSYRIDVKGSAPSDYGGILDDPFARIANWLGGNLFDTDDIEPTNLEINPIGGLVSVNEGAGNNPRFEIDVHTTGTYTVSIVRTE